MGRAGTSFWTGFFGTLEAELPRCSGGGGELQIFTRTLVNCPPCDGIQIAPSAGIHKSTCSCLDDKIGLNQVLNRFAQGIF